MKRFNISMNDDILAMIDDFCSKRGLTRSALLSTSAVTYIEAQEQIPSVQEQLDELKRALSVLQETTIK